MGGGMSKRYIGGKSPERYFNDDLYPSLESKLLKLNLEEDRAFVIFQIFVKADTDLDEHISVKELAKHVGNRKSKFTERVLLSTDNTYSEEAMKEGINFETFIVNLWHYCTLSSAGIARYCFELFDVDNLGVLEKPDLETMYKMLYDCDEHDDKQLQLFPLNPNDESVTKKDFIDHARKNKHLIQPAIDYQVKLQKKIGGVVMWTLLASFRHRRFHVHDETAPTLADALVAILDSEEVVRKKVEEDVDAIMAEQAARIAAEEAEFAREMKEREEAERERKKKAELKPEDKVLIDAWKELEDMKTDFQDTKWTIEKMKKRIQRRQAMFDHFDTTAALYNIYHQKKERDLIEITTGTDADHWARMKDFCKSKKGGIVYKRTKLLHTFALINARLEEKAKKKGFSIKKGQSTKRKTKQELQIEAAITGLEDHRQKEIDLEELFKTDPLAARAKQKMDDERNAKESEATMFKDEADTAYRAATAEETAAAEKSADQELFETIRARTMAELDETIAEQREEHRRFLVKKEFDIITNFGSRTTHWEELFDKKAGVYIYLNSETGERKHIKTAICEKCDGCFAQSDIRCPTCDAVRSARAQKLYRPLGYANITDE
jgi:hypothetical protein